MDWQSKRLSRKSKLDSPVERVRKDWEAGTGMTKGRENEKNQSRGFHACFWGVLPRFTLGFLSVRNRRSRTSDINLIVIDIPFRSKSFSGLDAQ